MKVRVLVVDDHSVVRRGLRVLLGAHPEWEIVDEAADGIEAIENAKIRFLDLGAGVAVLAYFNGG